MLSLIEIQTYISPRTVYLFTVVKLAFVPPSTVCVFEARATHTTRRLSFEQIRFYLMVVICSTSIVKHIILIENFVYFV